MSTTSETASQHIEDVLTVREMEVLDLHNPTRNSARTDALVEMELTRADTSPWDLEDLGLTLAIALSSLTRAVDNLRESVENLTSQRA